MASTFLPQDEHLAAEFAARLALERAGFKVEREADGVRVSRPGFTCRARAARLLANDLLPRGWPERQTGASHRDAA